MTKTEQKHQAQDAIMRAIGVEIEYGEEKGYTPEQIEAIREQAKRVMKFLGYSQFDGIGSV